jgi:hypothetical protein
MIIFGRWNRQWVDTCNDIGSIDFKGDKAVLVLSIIHIIMHTMNANFTCSVSVHFDDVINSIRVGVGVGAGVRMCTAMLVCALRRLAVGDL